MIKLKQKGFKMVEGSDTPYYDIPQNAKNVQDIIEHFEMNFAQGNILKSIWCCNIGRHSGTDYERDLNKIIWFANRELKRIKANESK